MNPHTNFPRKKWPIHVPPIYPIFLTSFLPWLPNFSKIFLNLSQFGLKFGKLLKNWSIYILAFAFYKGSLIYQEADFATQVCGTSPWVFYTEYPPPPANSRLCITLYLGTSGVTDRGGRVPPRHFSPGNFCWPTREKVARKKGGKLEEKKENLKGKRWKIENGRGKGMKKRRGLFFFVFVFLSFFF